MESISNNASSSCQGVARPSILHVLLMHGDDVIMSFLDKKLYLCVDKVAMVDKALDALGVIKEKACIIDEVICEVVEMSDQKVVQDFVRQIQSVVNIPVKSVFPDSYEARVLKCTSDVCSYTLKGPMQYAVEKSHRKLDNAVNKITVSAESVRRDDNGPVGMICSNRPRRRRVVWTSELHQAFVDAVYKLGIMKAVPKKILETMNKPELTRENVASHLQKYRLYLKRQQNVAHVQQVGKRRHKSASDAVDNTVASTAFSQRANPTIFKTSQLNFNPWNPPLTFKEDMNPITKLNGMQLNYYANAYDDNIDKLSQYFARDTISSLGHGLFENDVNHGWELGLHYPINHVDNVGLVNGSADPPIMNI